jgi:hypothetical protein
MYLSLSEISSFRMMFPENPSTRITGELTINPTMQMKDAVFREFGRSKNNATAKVIKDKKTLDKNQSISDNRKEFFIKSTLYFKVLKQKKTTH